jgi:predicted RNase H-like HicB family nuclease
MNSFKVVWSNEDSEYVATVEQYPSLSWLAKTPVEALQGLEGLLRDEFEQTRVKPEGECIGCDFYHETQRAKGDK